MTAAATTTETKADEPGFRRPAPTAYVYRKGLLKEPKPAAMKRG